MGLALLDVADVIRPHPEVVAFLRARRGRGLPRRAAELDGRREARDAIQAYLDTYGMRCVGEIDITRPRWSERPTTLVPVILGNVKNFEPGAGERRFEQGRQEAWAKEQELLERLRALPDGEQKAEEAKRMIDRVRTFIGYREYPKYGMVSRYFVVQAGPAGGGRAPRAGRRAARAGGHLLPHVPGAPRRRAHERRSTTSSSAGARTRSGRIQALTPPRVLTSDGEAIAGAYRRDDVPAGALVGLPVSAGTVEGRARVILDMAEADLEPGDILVTAYTDPSWTPLFVAIAGLVTEVGGLMTHGAVIAREYGLPAVVGVEHATRLIRDGQRIRVHGTDGYVEILAERRKKKKKKKGNSFRGGVGSRCRQRGRPHLWASPIPCRLTAILRLRAFSPWQLVPARWAAGPPSSLCARAPSGSTSVPASYRKATSDRRVTHASRSSRRFPVARITHGPPSLATNACEVIGGQRTKFHARRCRSWSSMISRHALAHQDQEVLRHRLRVEEPDGTVARVTRRGS